MSGTKALVFELIGIDRASETFHRVSAAVTETETRMTGMQRAGQLAGKALAVGLAGVAFGAIEATKAAVEDQQQQAVFEKQITNTTGAAKEQISALNEWVARQGELYGVSKDDLEPALSKLATATGSVAKAQRLASLAMDVSAGSGKDLNTVAGALAKAAQGNVSGLARLGVATKDAAGHTLSLTQITDSLTAKYHGDAATAADTIAGKNKIMGVEFHELMVKIGTGLIPVMTKLAGVLLSMVGFISQHITTFEILGAVFLSIAAAIKIMTIAQAAFNLVMDANPVMLVVIAIAALAAGLIVAYKKSETFRDIVNAVFHGIAVTVGAVVGFIKDHWKLLLVILTGPIGAAVLVIATHWATIKAGISTLVGWLKAAWPPVKAIITAPFQAAQAVVGDVWAGIKTGFGAVRDTLSAQAATVKSVLSGAFNAVKSVVNDVVGAVQSLIDKIESAINAVKNFHLPHIPGLGRESAGGSLSGGGLTNMAHGDTTDVNVSALTGRRGVGAARDGDLGTITLRLVDRDGRETQRALLKLKRENGGLALGLA